MDTLKNPSIPKTEQMKIDLANTCAGLEIKIAMLEKDLDTPANEEEEDEVTQYQIYTLLPDLIDNWPKLSFGTRLKFVGALTRKVIVSHPAPVWLKMVILWKRPEWGRDVAHIRRRAYKAAWSTEEEAVIRELYPHADALELLTRLPERTWNAIRVHSDELQVFRQRGSNTTTAYADYEDASLKDIQYAQENNLTFNGKKPQWILRCASQ